MKKKPALTKDEIMIKALREAKEGDDLVLAIYKLSQEYNVDISFDEVKVFLNIPD